MINNSDSISLLFELGHNPLQISSFLILNSFLGKCFLINLELELDIIT